MKKIIFAIASLMVLIVSCEQTPKDKMEELVKARMTEEYVSYESIKFGDKIDTVYTKLSDFTTPWENLFDEQKREFDRAMILKDIEGAQIHLNAMTDCTARIDSLTKNFEPKLVGYSIKHVFKHNDNTHTMVFLIDKDLTKVIKSYNE